MTDPSARTSRTSLLPAIDPKKFEGLEQSFLEAKDPVKLGRLYLSFAAQQSSAPAAALRLRRGVQSLSQLADSQEQVSWLLHELVRLDPSDEDAFDAVRTYYESTEKHRELIRLLEDLFERSENVPAARARELRQELYTLYRDKTDDKAKAAQQLAALLDFDDAEQEWLDAGEELLQTRGLIMHLGAPLSRAYMRQGKAAQELSLLTRELEVARGARLTEVQSRLAALRHDFLDDTDGAMELLEPLVARDPTDDEARERYLAISAAQDRLPDAARRIKRALSVVSDPEARMRVGLDLGRTLIKVGDREQAKQELVEALQAHSSSRAALSGAHLLIQSFDLSPKERVLCFSAIAANESEPARRHEAASALMSLGDTEGVELTPEQKKAALLALLDSDSAPGLLDELESLCESSGDELSLSRVFGRRAELAQTPDEASAFAFKAADLFERATGDKASHLERWQRYTERFPQSAAGAERVANLLEDAGRIVEVVDFLKRCATALQAEEAARFLARAGETQLTKLEDVDAALQSFSEALERSPDQVAAIAALEDLMNRGAKRLEAAAILEAVARRVHNDALLVDVLAVKSELISDAEARKAADIEMFELLRNEVRDPQRALALAARVLKEATRDPAALLAWLERIRSVETPEELYSLKARVLSTALGDRDIDSPELFALARDAGGALTQAGNFDAASAVYEKALQYDPAAADLALGLDALRAKQGIAGAQRVAYLELSLIDVEENLQSWCRVMAAIASIHRNVLGDPEAAAEAYKDVIERAPEDREAHRALVEIYQDMSDNEQLGAELERAIGVFAGTDKLRAEFALAMLRADSGDQGKAVELCNKLLDTGSLTSEQLDSIADLAEQQGNPALLRRVQERRIEDAADPLMRAQELERLGVLLSEQLDDKDGGAEAFKRAAQASLDVEGEEEYAKTLFERVLDVKPNDEETAQQFVRFCIDAGDWDRIPTGMSAMLGVDPVRAASFVLELAKRATEDKVAARYVAVLDEVLDAVAADADAKQKLLAAKADVLASDPGQRLDASQAFRAVIEEFKRPEDEAAFERFIRKCPLDDDRTDDQRWLFARRAESSQDPVSVLLEWARVEEEEFADPEAAIAVYDRLIESHPGERRALERAARLKLQCGAYEGTLEVLRRLEAAVPKEHQAGVQLRIASLLIGELARPEQGYAELEALLSEHPDNQLALGLGFEGLQSDVNRVLAARALGKVVSKVSAPEAVLTRMLDALAETDELADERSAWYDKLIGLKQGEAALALSCAAASQLPDRLALWERAEQLGTDLELPEPVAKAYEQALARELPQELVAVLGRRMLEFHEQWFGDSAGLLPSLLNLLKQTPHARWALDRAVLALNGQGRFEEAFGLFDAAITYAPEGDERASLLDEAALTAKDLAGDAERAIGYLEQLVELRPDDMRAQSTLERLYKRCGHTRKLIDLLTKRLADLKGPDLIAMLDQIACRWLELDHADEALASVRQILDIEPANERACQILERILGTEAFAEPDAWDSNGSSELTDTREQAAELLKATYQRLGRLSDVVRIAEGELEFLDDASRRGEVLREIVAAKLGDLNDRLGAFTSLSKLVTLEPTAEGPREQLRALAEELDEPRRYAEILVRAAENSSVECQLYLAAAREYTDKLDDTARETELYERVLQLAPDDQTVLAAARALDRLLSGTEDVDHHCEVLERLAGVEAEEAPRRSALVRAARIASDSLLEWERAARNWRDVLAFAPNDKEALDGLIDVLLGAKQWVDVIPVLEVRAKLHEGKPARADHVLIARTFADHLADNKRAIERWQLVREVFGPDLESFNALATLLEAEARWEAYAELLATEAANADGERRAQLLVLLASVRRDHLRDYSGALEAFVSAREWRDAVSIIEAADTPERAAELTDSLRVIAIERWHAGDELAEDAAYWAIKSRAQQLLDLMDADKGSKAKGRRGKGTSPEERAFALLTESIQLPFSVARRRSLQRSAALVSSDALGDRARALEIFARMFDEDVTDSAAIKSVQKYSELLDHDGRHVDRAQLWERIARALARIGDEAGARSYWEHAGKLWEQLEEAPLAIAAYRRAAELGSVESLEALTRLHLAGGAKYHALDSLERIFDLSSAEALVDCTKRLVDLCVELGERHKARTRLETAVLRVPEELSLRARLATLYREERAYEPLAKLLVGEVPLREDVEQRVGLLLEAANLYLEKLAQPAAAIPLLEQASELHPDDKSLRLAIASAQSAAGLHEQAISRLTAEVEAYGARRPKTRARAHRKLAHAFAKAGKHEQALQQLSQAAEINATDAGVLFEYGTAALKSKDFERAEQTFRASLLVLHRQANEGTSPVTRADVYLSLSDLAAEKGERLATKDFIESAFEIALEGPDEALQLEMALKARGKDELLKRALETRLSRAPSVIDKIRALSELTGVYSRLDDKEARVESVKSAAARLEASLGGGANDAQSWRELSRVYAWLEDKQAEIDSLAAYLAALPVSEYRSTHADACYRVAEARIAAQAEPNAALSLLVRAVALDPAPERRDPLITQALRVYPEHAGFARAAVQAAKSSGRENQLAEALTHLAELPDATLEEGRTAVRQCASVGNAELMERATTALLARSDLDTETRYYLKSQLAQHFRATSRWAEAFDLTLSLAEEAEPPERVRLLRDAAQLLESGLSDDRRAAQVYRKLLSEQPTDRSVWEPLFATYLRLGDHGELREIIEQTLPKVRGADRGALRLAQARLLLTDDSEVDAAVATLEKALEEDPSQREAAELLAETLERLGRLDELVGVFEGQLQAARVARDRQTVEALTLRVGALLKRANRPQDAAETYQAFLSENPEHLEALRALAALVDAAKLQDPVSTLRRLLKLEDSTRAAQVALKLHGLLGGDAPFAIEVLEEGFAKCPTDPDVMRRLVDAHRHSYDVEGAAEVLARAVEAVPGNTALLLEAVDAWVAAGQPERALALLDVRLGDRPGDEALHFKRSQILASMERDDEALAALQRAHDEGGKYTDELIAALDRLSQKKGRPESDLLVLRLSDLLERRGDDAQAREHLRGLLLDSPDNAEALMRLATLAEKHDDTADAIQAYRGLMRLEQGDNLVPIVFKLIDACEKLERLTDVLDDLERAREKLPDHERLRDRIRVVYEKSGETNRLAEVLIDDAARRDKPQDKAELLTQAARLLIDTDPTHAQALLEQAEQAHSSLESGVLLARLKALRGQRDEAIADLERLSEPSDSRKPAARVGAYWELSQLYLRGDELKEAYDVLLQAQKLERRNGEVSLLLGMLALDLDDEKTAGRALRAVTAMKARTATSQGAHPSEKSKAYYLLGFVARQKGDTNAARRMVQKAVTEDPENSDAQSLLEALQ